METLESLNDLRHHMYLYGSTITQCLAHVLLENQSCKVKVQINVGKSIKNAEIFKVRAIQGPHVPVRG